MMQIRLLYFIVIFILCFENKNISQSHETLDSLLRMVNEELIDSGQMFIHREIGDYYMNNNASKAIDYFERARQIASALKLKTNEAANHYSIAYCYIIKGDFDHALENYLQAVRIYEELGHKRRLTNAYIAVATLYADYNKLDKSRDYFSKAERLIEITQDTFEWLTYLSEVGIIFYKQSKYDSAIIFLKKAHNIAVLSNDSYLIPTTLVNLGLMYKKLGDNEQALYYTDSALHVFIKMKSSSHSFATVYNNFGSIYAQAGQIEKAKEAFHESLRYCFESNSRLIEMENYLNMSDMFEKIGDWKNHSYYLKKHFGLKDSIFTADNKYKLTELESDYLLEKKNKELYRKEAEVAKQRTARNLFIFIAIAGFLLLTVMIYAYIKIERKKRIVEEQRDLITYQKSALDELNSLKDRLFSIISHDLRNPIITLRSYLLLSDNESLTADKKLLFKNQTMQAVTQTGELLDNLLAWANMQLKNTEVNIVPVDLKECVDDVISSLHLQAAQKKIQIKSRIQEQMVPADVDILSIALRNLITNAIKFSREHQEILITSKNVDQKIYISVQDFGLGMSLDQIERVKSYASKSSKGTHGEKGSGLGIFLISELLRKLNGTLQIESKEGEGSTFTIELASFV
ncbi:MAG: tetratricopeptide repeat protein [Saprospiraceae bacterium]|nr:tetratricopeptide repeat protein [Saprospiraceae bacterium]